MSFGALPDDDTLKREKIFCGPVRDPRRDSLSVQMRTHARRIHSSGGRIHGRRKENSRRGRNFQGPSRQVRARSRFRYMYIYIYVLFLFFVNVGSKPSAKAISAVHAGDSRGRFADSMQKHSGSRRDRARKISGANADVKSQMPINAAWLLVIGSE